MNAVLPRYARCTGACPTRILWVLVALLALAMAPANAEENPYLFEFGAKVGGLGWLPGENYDPFTGQMHHRMTDLVFEGNGIPIEITRIINQGGPKSITFDFPALAFTSPTNNFKPAECGGYDVDLIDEMRISMDGTIIDFYNRDEMPTEVSHFPADALYVNKNNWFVKCSSDYKYVAYSPEGYLYTFSKLNDISRPINLRGYLDGNHKIEGRVIESITDSHGNTLNFVREDSILPYQSGTSDGDWNRGSPGRLKRIITSDGREVVFNYGRRLHDSVYYYHLSSIETNGSPVSRNVSYTYIAGASDNQPSKRYSAGYKVDIGEGRQYTYRFSINTGSALLLSVSYPEGGAVSYQYTSDCCTGTNDFHKHSTVPYRPMLARHIESDPGVSGVDASWKFSHHNLTSETDAFARVITTPFNTSEYWYRKSSSYAGGVSSVLIDDGKLINTSALSI